MTIQELSQQYPKTFDPTKPLLETAYITGATTVMDIVTDLIHTLQSEGKGLWAASYVLEKLNELKGEKEG